MKPIIRKAKRAEGVYYVELKLDIAVAKKVEVFGDFQASRQWKVKLPCEKVGSTQWACSAYLRPGDKFKFVVDDGKLFAASARFPKCLNGIGGQDNLFLWHARSETQNNMVRSRYGVLRIPAVK